MTVSGVVQRIDSSKLEIRGSDFRYFSIALKDSTHFEGDDGKVTAEDLEPGRKVRVFCDQDAEDWLTARTVTLLPDDRKRQDTSQPPSEPDPDRPTLKRGAPVKPRHAPESWDEGPQARVAAKKTTDDFVERARVVATELTQSLPNYVCQQLTTRYIRGERTGFRALDIVKAEVLVYDDGREQYKNITIDGKPVNKPMEEMPGAWSTGEFAGTLKSLFDLRTDAEFKFHKATSIEGHEAKEYAYNVKRERSDWRVLLGSQYIIPGYSGTIWLDAKTAHALRIEVQADDIPELFPLDHVEAAQDYTYVRLGSESFFLPVHAENLSCKRNSSVCSKNTIDFRNCHKFTGESVISFGEEKPEGPETSKPESSAPATPK